MFNRDSSANKNNKLLSHVRSLNITEELVGTKAMLVQPPTPPKAHRRFDALAHVSPLPEASPASKLIVGPRIKLKGVEITDCDTLVVEGRVEASMESRLLQIAEDGVFAGTATMDVAEIRGRFEGNLTVRKNLIIHATGCVTGSVRYGAISIEEGGTLSGDVSTLANLQIRDSEPAPSSQAGVPIICFPVAGTR